MSEFKEFINKLIKTAGPMAFQHLMLAMVAVSDAFMLGNVEQNAMSAVSLATQVQFLQNIITGSVIAATSILGAQYWGRKNKKALNHVFAIGIYFSVSIALITFAGCIFFPRVLMGIFTNETILIDIGIKYLRIAGWSYLLTGISQVYLTIMKVSDHPAMTAKISSVAVVINIVLNAVFIFGFGPVKAMGVEGAAIATLIARVIELVWIVICSFRQGYIHPEIKSFFEIEAILLKDFVKNLLPLLGACLFWGVGFSSYTAFMGHLGTDAAAANSVTAVIRDLICCMCDGASAGAGILVGNELGAGNLEKAKLYGDRFVKISFIIGFISTGLMLLATPFLLSAVKLTPEARHYLMLMMIVMAFYMIGRAVNTVVINGVLAAGGDTMFDFYSLAVTMWCVSVPLAALGTFYWHFPVVLVYAFTCLDEVGKIPWVIYHYKRYKWLKDLTREI